MTSTTDSHNAEIRRAMGISGALIQPHHAAINARHPGLTREHCFICEQETGRAGRGEDSIYDGDDMGPYCVECRETHGERFEE